MQALNERLKQVYHAMDSVMDSELSTTKIDYWRSEKLIALSVDFSGGATSEELKNQAALLLHNVASIKDHFHRWCERNGRAKNGDALINSNKEVAIVHDLWNSEKHGDPASSSRSQEYPRVEDLRRVARLRSKGNGQKAIMVFDTHTGQFVVNPNGDLSQSLSGRIVNKSGVLLGEFLDTVEKTLTAWEAHLTAAGCVLPHR